MMSGDIFDRPLLPPPQRLRPANHVAKLPKLILSGRFA
jgi:hypothetical protein